MFFSVYCTRRNHLNQSDKYYADIFYVTGIISLSTGILYILNAAVTSVIALNSRNPRSIYSQTFIIDSSWNLLIVRVSTFSPSLPSGKFTSYDCRAPFNTKNIVGIKFTYAQPALVTQESTSITTDWKRKVLSTLGLIIRSTEVIFNSDLASKAHTANATTFPC